MADKLQHGQVVDGVAVSGAAGQVEPLAVGERLDRRRLGLPMQQTADEPSRVQAIHGLRDRAEGAGQPEPAR